MSCPQRASQQVQPRQHLWNSHHLHNRDIDHRVHRQLRNLHGQQDHGDQPLRRNREDDNLWNSHELHNRGIDHLINVQLEISMVRRTVGTM